MWGPLSDLDHDGTHLSIRTLPHHACHAEASRTGTTEPSSISIPPPTPAQPGSNAASSSTPTRPEPPVPRAIAVDESHASPTPLHACPHCHTRFLTATGLERHMSTHGHEVQADGNLVRAAKIPKLDTVPAMLTKLCQVIETPSKSFRAHCAWK